MPPPKVIIYTTDNCSYCERAKTLLKQEGTPYQEFYVDLEDRTARLELCQRSEIKTFLQIFYNFRLIGGHV